ncbi:MAG: bifunctional 4-hydroxy-3-methylbut-2-enyl diphosphate reductase/30S ribosomal protein S1 [Christensenellales bacterium]
MPVEVAGNAGFCMGVKRAVSTALTIARQARVQGIQTFTLGELIHNPVVIAALEKEGIKPVRSPEDAHGAILIIRSHGTDPHTLMRCHQSASKVVDCTCPFVQHVHRLVEAHSSDGSPVIILGDKNHPEIVGIIGWCSGSSYVISDAWQIDHLPKDMKGALLVSQTTFSPAQFSAMLPLLLSRYPGLRYKNTICKATETRQAEAEALAKRSEMMVVVGGKHSANTRKLAQTCRTLCPRTYLVESAQELREIVFDPVYERIGITAGASTPVWSLKEVVDFMNDKELNGQVQNPEETPQVPEEILDTAVETVPESQEVETVVEEVPTTQTNEEALAEDAPAKEAVAEAIPEAAPAEETVAEAVPEAAPADETVAEAVPEAAPAEEMVAEAVPEAAPAEETVVEAESEAVPAKETPATEAVQAQPKAEPSFMDAVAASMARIRTGQTITGKVVQITDDEVCVNIGYKSDGLLKRDEMVDKDVELGDEIEVEVVKVNDGEGNVILSQRNIVNRKVWAELMEKYHNSELVIGIGREAVKGGLLASVHGVRAFIPASHLAQRYVDKISQFVGQELKLKIIEVDETKKRLVASRKEALAQESAAIREAVWSQLEEGAVVKGIVRRFTNFGAFVDLGGVDGLIHVSDLSWNRSVVPSEVLTANQEIEVKILSLDRERDRISLGYKQLQPRPWDNVEEKYPVGSILTRKIVRVRPFGAFIELEPGVDGLVHISQISHTRVEKIEDAVHPGQEVNVKVLSVDPVAKRISLSIRETLEVPYFGGAQQQYDNKQAQSNQDSLDQAPQYEPPAPAETDRPETAVELAMRKAREELEAQEQNNKPEAE